MRKVKFVTFLIPAVLIGLSAYMIYTTSLTPTAWRSDTFRKRIDAKRQEIYSNLGLTDQQKKLLEENKNRYRGQSRALYAQMRQKMNSLRQELEKSEFDIQKIYQINNELKQLQAQMVDNRLESILEVRKILPPGQFKKFEDKMNERMGRFSRGQAYDK